MITEVTNHRSLAAIKTEGKLEIQVIINDVTGEVNVHFHGDKYRLHELQNRFDGHNSATFAKIDEKDS